MLKAKKMWFNKKIYGFVLFFVLISIFIYLNNVSALEGFQYNATIMINNTNNPNTLTDYQILVTLNTQRLISEGKMQDDCDDIRFTDNDTTTLLPYWIESGCNTTNTKIWVKVPEIPASSTKVIYLYYGNSEATSLSNFSLLTPNYIGTEFYSTCLVASGTGGTFLITSYENDNVIKIYRSDTWSLVTTINLNMFQSTSWTCNTNYPYYINSTKKTSLSLSTIGPDASSDDDVTSVYADKIWIKIPGHLWVCSYDNNNFVRIQRTDLTNLWSGTLNEGECYLSTTITNNYYYINATYPITAQFGYEDNDIYKIIYGKTFPNGTQIYYFYSHGFTIVSSLYPNTFISIENLETGIGNWTGTLNNEGDYVKVQQISSFNGGTPEYVKMKITANKPIIVYTEGDGYNYGMEQIPSINGKGVGNYFVFRTGNCSSDYPRHIRIIGTEQDAQVNVSGCISASTTINRGQQVEYSCATSYGLVKISSNKPVAVFERGDYTEESFLIILPYKYTSPEPTISFIPNFTYDPIFNLEATENTTENFSLMVYSNEIENITSANLTYDGVKYAAEITQINSTTWKVTATINVGPISSDLKENKTFNWSVRGETKEGFPFNFTTENYNQTLYILFRDNLTFNQNAIEFSIQPFNYTQKYSYLAVKGTTTNISYGFIENIITTGTATIEKVVEINQTFYIRTPAVSSQYNETKFFNVSTQVELLNGTFLDYTKEYNQSVYKLVINTTSSPSPSTLIYTHNYKNEENPSATVNGNFNTLVYVFLPENFGKKEYYRNYTFTTSGTTQNLYLYPSWANASLIIEMENTATGFLKREHYLCRNFGNTSFTVNQHLLNESNPEWLKFFFNVLDINSQPLENYVITIEKEHNFDWIYLGARKTDRFGQFVEKLIPEKKYRLKAYNPNWELEKEWYIFIICKEVPCVYDLVISETGKPYEPLEEIEGFSYSWNFERETKTLMFGYNYDGNQTFKKITFYVIKKSPEKEEKFCEELLLENSGGAQCNLSNFTSGSFTGYAIVEIGQKKKVLFYNFDLLKKELGLEGLIWALLIILLLFFIGIWNPVAAICGAVLGIIIVSIMGVASLPYIFILLIITLVIVIIIKLKT